MKKERVLGKNIRKWEKVFLKNKIVLENFMHRFPP